jgi:hypothetical protein
MTSLQKGFGLVIGFNRLFYPQLLTTLYYSLLGHTLRFTSHCLVAALSHTTGNVPLLLSFRTALRLSHSNLRLASLRSETELLASDVDSKLLCWLFF